jgi:hypothetical protein
MTHVVWAKLSPGPGCGLGVGKAARAGFGPWPGSKRASLGRGVATPCWAGLLAVKSWAASLGRDTRAGAGEGDGSWVDCPWPG